MNSDTNPMSDMQKQIRQYIIEKQRLPDDIDILVFNKAYETSINIYGNIEAVFKTKIPSFKLAGVIVMT